MHNSFKWNPEVSDFLLVNNNICCVELLYYIILINGATRQTINIYLNTLTYKAIRPYFLVKV